MTQLNRLPVLTNRVKLQYLVLSEMKDVAVDTALILFPTFTQLSISAVAVKQMMKNRVQIIRFPALIDLH